VSALKVLVLADEDNDLRVAHVLAGDGQEVSLHGSARSGRYPSVDDPSGFDVVVGYGEAVLELAEKAGAAAVTAADVNSSPVPTVAAASLLGAALAIAARLTASGSEVVRVGIAHPVGPSVGGVAMNFPPPVGRARGTILSEAPFEVLSAATQAPWAAITVEADTGNQAVVDEHRFLIAICLAAGVSLIPPAGIVKVWDSPDAYLSKAETMGLVAAQRTDA
jgi:hypothetical protein